jgi:hypothetical protein
MTEIFGVAAIASVVLMLVHAAYSLWRRRLYAIGLLVGLAGSALAALILTVLTSN